MATMLYKNFKYHVDTVHIAAKFTRRSGQEAKKYFGLDSLQSIIFPFTNVKLVKK